MRAKKSITITAQKILTKNIPSRSIKQNYIMVVRSIVPTTPWVVVKTIVPSSLTPSDSWLSTITGYLSLALLWSVRYRSFSGLEVSVDKFLLRYEKIIKFLPKTWNLSITNVIVGKHVGKHIWVNKALKSVLAAITVVNSRSNLDVLLLTKTQHGYTDGVYKRIAILI